MFRSVFEFCEDVYWFVDKLAEATLGVGTGPQETGMVKGIPCRVETRKENKIKPENISILKKKKKTFFIFIYFKLFFKGATHANNAELQKSAYPVAEDICRNNTYDDYAQKFKYKRRPENTSVDMQG